MSDTKTNMTAAIALLMALLVLAVTALPAQAQTTDEGSVSSFGLDEAATQDTLKEGATMQASTQPSGTTIEPSADPKPESTVVETKVAPPQQAQTVAVPSTTQYQDGYLADTGGVSPHKSLAVWGVLALGLVGLTVVNLRSLTTGSNRKDDDVFFG